MNNILDMCRSLSHSGKRNTPTDQHIWEYLLSRIEEPPTAQLIIDYLESPQAEKDRMFEVYIRAKQAVQQSNGASETCPQPLKIVASRSIHQPASENAAQHKLARNDLEWPVLDLA